MLSGSTPDAPSSAVAIATAVNGRPRLSPWPAPPQSPATPDTTALVVVQLRRACAELETVQPSFPELVPAIRALHRLERRLTRPMRIAIIGEFNSGKSSLTNLLVGIDSLPTAIVSNTRIPTLLYHAAAPEIFAMGCDGARTPVDGGQPLRAAAALRLEVGLPSARLAAVEFIDLPGLADPRFDEAAADLALHGVDAVLWCTVATQAWKESERQAWSARVPRLRQRGILVVTHRDLLLGGDDEARLLARLRGVAAEDFQDVVMLSTAAGAEPPHIALPPDDTEAAREAGDLGALERSIDRLLDSVRQARGVAAVEVTNRIAGRALARMRPDG